MNAAHDESNTRLRAITSGFVAVRLTDTDIAAPAPTLVKFPEYEGGAGRPSNCRTGAASASVVWWNESVCTVPRSAPTEHFPAAVRNTGRGAAIDVNRIGRQWAYQGESMREPSDNLEYVAA
jgi:hypothetical protein